jgi:hypothetical protein
MFLGPAFAVDVESPVTPAPTKTDVLRKSRRLLPDIFPSFQKLTDYVKIYFEIFTFSNIKSYHFGKFLCKNYLLENI